MIYYFEVLFSVNEAIVYGISDVKRGQVPIALVTVKQQIDKTVIPHRISDLKIV